MVLGSSGPGVGLHHHQDIRYPLTHNNPVNQNNITIIITSSGIFNLLGGITLLPISVPKAVQVSSRLWDCEECGYRLMTILRRPLSLADSAEVDCNTVMASCS